MSEEPVVVPAIMFSDHVIREAGTNKLSLLGCFAVWNASAFPFQAPPFFITPFLSNFRNRNGVLDITVNVENGQRLVLWSATAKINFQTTGQTLPPDALIEIPFRATGVAFPEPGRYFARLFVNAEEMSQRPFSVQSSTATNPPPNPKQ